MSRPLLRALLGLVISAVAVALVIRQVDLGAAWEVLRAAAPAWVAAAFACIALDVALRALRWRALLAPVARLPLPSVAASLLVGYLANNVLPARLGELVRSHHLGDRTGVSRASVLGTVVVERVVDTGVLVTIASAAIVVLSVRGLVASAVLLGLAATGFLVAGLALALVAHRLPFADRAVAVAERRPAVARAATRLRGGLAVAGRPRTMAEAIGWSVVAWGATIVAFAAAGQAIGVELTWGQAALLAGGVSLVTAIPAGPGYVGTFELAAVEIARAVGIAPDPAFALALLVHAAILAITS
ncbi:MAG: lysylphosphatidylglycerol synthase transmembrane domain-containing protein, partial [Chloroflexota bacterium]